MNIIERFSVSRTPLVGRWVSVLQASLELSPALGITQQGGLSQASSHLPLMAWNRGNLNEQEETWGGKHFQYLTLFFFSGAYFSGLTSVWPRKCEPMGICMIDLN